MKKNIQHFFNEDSQIVVKDYFSQDTYIETKYSFFLIENTKGYQVKIDMTFNDGTFGSTRIAEPKFRPIFKTEEEAINDLYDFILELKGLLKIERQITKDDFNN